MALAVVAAACTEATPDEAQPLVVPVPRAEAPARTTGFDTTVFRLGVIADLSGPDASFNRSLLAGVEAYWSSVNALGGVDGRFPVELVVRDVGTSAAAAVNAYSDLEPDVAAFALVTGTATIDAVRELATRDQVLMVPGTRQSTWAGVPSLLPVGSSYAAESFNGAAWMSRDDTEPAAWCVVTDGSAVGSDQLVGVLLAEQVLEEIGSPVTEIPARPLEEFAGAAVDAGCERLWLAADATESTQMVDALAQADVDLAVGVGGEILLPPSSAAMSWATDHLMVSTDSPSWGDEGAGASQLRAAMDAHLPDARPDAWIRAGFAAQYAVDVVLRSGTIAADVTRGTLWATAGTLADVNAGGLATAFDRPAGPSGAPRAVTIFAVDGIAGDPLGLRVVERFESPAAGVLDLLTSNG